MATSAVLSDKIRSTLTSIFGNNTRLKASIDSEVLNSASLKLILESVVALGGLTLEETAKFKDISSTLDLTDYDDSLTCFLLDDKSIKVPSQIAFKYYYTESIHGFADEKVSKLKAKLFEKQPLSVLFAAIGEHVLLENHKLALAVRFTLYQAIELGVPIFSKEFQDAIHSEGFFEKSKLQPPPSAEDVYDLLKNIQRLQYVVSDPAHIDILLKQNLYSAHDIANLDKKTFLNDVAASGVEKKILRQIHDHATELDSRNQETWAKILKYLSDDFTPGISTPWVDPDTQSGTVIDLKDSRDPAALKETFNMTDIFNLQFSSCEDCCSVISASAYFVDLLKFLKTIKADESKNKFPTAFDALKSRRPDLVELELSCANSKNMIPYISIVNETLESAIYKLTGNPERVARVGNESIDTEEDYAAHASDASTSDIFKIEIAQQMYPLQTFPYNQALDALQRYLCKLGSSRLELLSVFRSKERLLNDLQRKLQQNAAIQTSLLPEADKVFDRAVVAETLGLQPLDFALICRETVYPANFIMSLSSLAAHKGSKNLAPPPLPETHELWGYADQASMLDIDEGKSAGLSFIRAKFLPRSGLDFEQLRELLTSLYFGKRLVITNVDESRDLTDQLSEMRLKYLNLSASGTTPAVGPLNETLCHELQSFIRLKNRLGWTISELDAAIATFTQSQIARDTAGSSGTTRGITFQILEDLSYAAKLSQLTRMPVSEILPLWADIITTGTNSLYKKLFLGDVARASGGGDTFQPNPSGELFSHREEIGSCKDVVTATLNINTAALAIFIKSAGLTDTDELELESISSIYRHSVFCKILKVAASDYPSVLSLLSNVGDVFRDPRTTLDVVEKWTQLTTTGWSAKDILSTVGGSQPMALGVLPLGDTALRVVPTIGDGVDMLQNTWMPLIWDNSLTEVHVVSICSQLFDAPTAKSVSLLIEGNLVTSITANADDLQPIPSLNGTTEKFEVLVNPVSTGGTITVNLRGILLPDELTTLLNASSASEGFTAMLRDIDFKSKAPLTSMMSRLIPGHQNVANDEIFRLYIGDSADIGVSTSDESSTNDPATPTTEDLATDDAEVRTPTADDLAILHDKLLQKRRTEFAKLALPILNDQLLQDTVIQEIKNRFPTIEPSIFPSLLRSTAQLEEQEEISEIQVQQEAPNNPDTEKEPEAPLTVLRKVKYLTSEVGEIKTGYFRPAAADLYRFSFPIAAGSSDPAFAINGVNLVLKRVATGYQTNLVMLSTGVHYLLSSSIDLSNVSWSTKQSRPTRIGNTTLIPETAVLQVSSILGSVFCIAQAVSKFGLGLEELKYFSSVDGIISLDYNNLSFSDLIALEQYRKLRDSIAKDRQSLITLFGWLKNPTKSKDIGKAFAEATIWPSDQVSATLLAKYPSVPSLEIIRRLCDLNNLESLQRVMEVSKRMAQTVRIPMTTLFRYAVPAHPARISDDFKRAESFQMYLSKSQRAQCAIGLRETQRTALVQYLLQQKYFKNLAIFDADGLFEYFLIDVQMGPQLEITRMKQAISAVQLFVQRCLLGLEVKNGIQASSISRDEWAWKQRHNTWQATRKAFLYPENWLDPSLRDDKSDLFLEYETAITQKDFNWDTFTSAIKNYVYGLSRIADLEIQSYLREYRENEYEIYHLFGRTRTAPYQFYYRTMRLPRPSGIALWTPWSKIEIEATTYESDWNGSSISDSGSYLIPVMQETRLFLYMPQIMVKTNPPAPKTQKIPVKVGDKTQIEEKPASIQSMAQEEISASTKAWEIRMAWSEYLDGKWSAKKVSPASVNVLWAAQRVDDPLPSLANFTFDVKQERPRVTTISIACWRKNPNATVDSYLIGAFTIDNGRISLSQHRQLEARDKTLQTSFQKFKWSSNDSDEKRPSAPGNKVYSRGRSFEPLLAIPRRLGPRTLTWALSFGTDTLNEVSSLVVDENFPEGGGHSLLMYPKSESLNSSEVSSLALVDQCYTAYIEHTDSAVFMDSVSQKDGLDVLYTAIKKVSDAQLGKPDSLKGDIAYHELATPFALYNWELGLHCILLAMDRFLATQQFDQALRVARFVFDPTVDPARLGKSKVANSCWEFLPFTKITGNGMDISDKFQDWPEDKTLSLAAAERRINGSITHSTARGRPQAYMKWIIMKYVETLIAAGDESFRHNSLETLPLAIQRYIEALHILGPEPPKMPKLAKSVVRTYSTLKDGKVDLELAFPFMCKLDRRGSSKPGEDDKSKQSLLCILHTTYFCLPTNPQYKVLRELVNDRLYKTRNNLDINGRPLIYSMEEPNIDPGAMVRAQFGGASAISSLLNDMDSPMPFHRFSFLIGRALEICAELRTTGEGFLVVKEKRDVEALAFLKARQETARQNLMMGLKQLQRDELNQTTESLLQNRESAVSQLSYYLQLIGESLDKIPKQGDVWEDVQQQIARVTTDDLRMNPYELEEMISADRSASKNKDAAEKEIWISGLRALPRIVENIQPMGMGISFHLDAGNIADGASAYNAYTRTQGVIASDAAAKASRKAMLTRQLQERRMQANVKGREIQNIDKQIEIHKKKLEIIEKETTIQQLDIDHAVETEKWYISKYTNENLYVWMENSVRNMHYELYLLTTDIARRAEKALRFEKGGISTPFLRTGGYWDNSRDGLLAGQQLHVDLKRMEAAYLEKPNFDYQITKSVSLRQINPLALIDLKTTGSATFSLPELLFDVDYPGHYMRRIKSVAVSIPCLIGTHTSLSATFTLVKHKYRVRAVTSSGDEYNPTSGNEDQFRTDRVPITSVAISSGIQDSGVFELDFKDERFLPFEGAGAISTWKLELPSVVKQFDYQTISNVVLHLRYTSLDGGPSLKKAANEAVKSFREDKEKLSDSEGLWACYDLKNDFPNEWYAFYQSLVRQPAASLGKATLDLSSLPSRMPFWVQGSGVKVQRIAVVVAGDNYIDGSISMSLPHTDEGETDPWDKTRIGQNIMLRRNVIGIPLGGWLLEIDKSKWGNRKLDNISLVFGYIL